MHPRPQHGFNLLELMMALFVLAILLGIGVPSLRSFMDEGRMAGVANGLLTGLHLARGEAVKRQLPVTLCASAAPLAASPVCTAGMPPNGWVVFADRDGDAVIDADDSVIQAGASAPAVVNVTDNGWSAVTYTASGFRTDTAIPVLTAMLCDRRGMGHDPELTAARLVRIDATGRAQILRNADEITALGADCP